MKSVIASVCCMVRPKNNSELSIHLNLLLFVVRTKHTSHQVTGQPLKSLPKTVKTQHNQFQQDAGVKKQPPSIIDDKHPVGLRGPCLFNSLGMKTEEALQSLSFLKCEETYLIFKNSMLSHKQAQPTQLSTGCRL